MDVMHAHISGDAEVTISGNIKTIEDYQAIKEAVKTLVQKGKNNITVKVVDSISMTSSVIGFFLKLVCGENVKITMYVKDKRLYALLDTLNLLSVFDVKKL